MKKLISIGGLCLLLCGCSYFEATHLAYVSEATLGIDVAASTKGGTGRMVFGYDRGTYALVPRKGDGQDAMTITSVGCVYAKGLNEVQFNHFVASGSAAKNIAKNTETLEIINQAIHGGGNKCEPKK
jgi:hypothetical protein